ncbi:MAG: hypothetical protein HOG94_14010 [Nitrospinaceae bacterium]|nr:hypothetical protein [Nitrospinaceae bacterium]
MAVKIISLELDKRTLRAVKVRKGWRKLTLESDFVAELPGDPEDQEVWDRVRTSFHTWSKEGGQPNLISASLPGLEAIPSRLQFPFRRLSKIGQALKAEMESAMPLSVDETVADFVLSGEAKGDIQNVLAVGAPKSSLSAHLERLAKLDIDPDRIEYTPLTVAKTVMNLMPSYAKGIFGVLHIADSYVSFSLCEKEKPLFIRTFQRNDWLEATPEEDGVDGNPQENVSAAIDPDFLIKEMRRTLRACSALLENGHQIAHLVLSGEGNLSVLSQQLEAELGVHCREIYFGDGSRILSKDRQRTSRVQNFAAPLGAVLDESKSFGKGFDLRREEYARREGWRELRRPILTTAFAAAVLLAVGMGDLMLKVRHEEIRLNVVQSEVNTALHAVFPDGKRVSNPGRRITRQVETQTSRLEELLGGTLQGNTPLRVMAAISSSVPANVEIRMNHLLIDDKRISLKGETLNFESVDRIKKVLSKKKEFGAPEVKQAKLMTGKRGVEFLIELAPNGATKE